MRAKRCIKLRIQFVQCLICPLVLSILFIVRGCSCHTLCSVVLWALAAGHPPIALVSLVCVLQVVVHDSETNIIMKVACFSVAGKGVVRVDARYIIGKGPTPPVSCTYSVKTPSFRYNLF